MRCIGLLLAASVALSSGCAAMIAVGGKDLTSATSKEQVRTELGEPIAWGVEDGSRFEEFHTHRKISAAYSERLSTESMAWVCTLGTSDVLFVPYELYLITHAALFGQTVRVTYDIGGKVSAIAVEGEPLMLP
jgi:hypothetical protein